MELYKTWGVINTFKRDTDTCFDALIYDIAENVGNKIVLMF